MTYDPRIIRRIWLESDTFLRSDVVFFCGILYSYNCIYIQIRLRPNKHIVLQIVVRNTAKTGIGAHSGLIKDSRKYLFIAYLSFLLWDAEQPQHLLPCVGTPLQTNKQTNKLFASM